MANRDETMSPLISVVMPCFNLGRFVHEAIDSVLSQTLQDFDITIINDGSTDHATAEVLRAIDHPQIRVLHQENMGLARTRNNGIRASTGRYICCLDPDDRLAAGFFAAAADILNTRPIVGLVSGHFQAFGDREFDFRPAVCRFPELLASNSVVEPAVFRREAWEEAGHYCETFSSSGIEDWDLWISILEQGYSAEILPEIVWYYRIHPQQMSHTMYRPEVWRTLTEQLVLKHRDTYGRYFAGVICELSAQWADLRRWADDREASRAWWERQAQSWQQLSSEYEAKLVEQQKWIGELTEAREWQEGQSRDQLKWAEELERKISDQHRWIEELQRERDWLAKERLAWQKIAESRSGGDM